MNCVPQSRPLCRRISTLLLLTLGTASLVSQAADPADASAAQTAPTMETVNVYGEPEKTSTATRLDLSVFETPQTVTVISRAQIEDFALSDINELLQYTPGVTVESVETDRTYFTARGFDIVNFQYDGVGVPFSSGLAHGHPDTAIFEQVEVVKGAAGLITGLANPSATINYLRKRPLEAPAIGVSLSAGEEDHYRFDTDVTGPLGERVRGRLVVAQEKAGSYLDRREDDDAIYYGMLETDLTSTTLLTVGYSLNVNKSNGSLSGALPLYYTDGSPTDFKRSTSTATDWAYRDIDSEQTFVELKQQFGSRWTLNAQFTLNDESQDSELLYVYGTPDRNTGLGLFGYASGYILDEEQEIFDLFVSGSFDAGGQAHELVLGYNHADIDLHGQSLFDNINGFPVLGADWARGNTPRPTLIVYDTFTDAHKDKQTHESFYLATRLNIGDRLAVLLGARHMEVEQKGFNYGVIAGTSARETVPYYGATFDVTDSFALYASYSEVFTPQSWVDPAFQPLGVAEGDNTEIGMKMSFNDGNATGTLALFKSRQQNLGEFFGRDNANGTNTYVGREYESEGVELELAGAVTDDLNVSFGYTWLDLTDEDGDDTRTYVPRQLLKLAAAYRLPMAPALTAGASLRWQDDVYIRPEQAVKVTQESYALLDLFVRYTLSDHLSVTLNATNVSDEKYLTSLYWTQGYYGAPRQLQASLAWRFE